MISDIHQAALWVTGRESGTYTTDPWPSKWGVSQHYHPDLSVADIQSMTQAKAAALFVKSYWLPEWSALPTYLSIPMLSFSVLEGPGQAVVALQRALVVKPDGNVGPETLAAARTTENRRDQFLEAFFRECRKRFAESPRWILDGEGWVTRQFAASLAAKVWT